MKLMLHSPEEKNELSQHYERAFRCATELYIVTAYLTSWDASLKLNESCTRFRIIIGKDFGITKKSACTSVMNWLPAKRKSQFMVADLIDGFHPKAVFWSEGNEHFYAIVGSSNLTRAAFEKNYEANVFSEISNSEFKSAKIWIKRLEEKSVVVSGDWLSAYQEAERKATKKPPQKLTNSIDSGYPSLNMWLPNPEDAEMRVSKRQEQMRAYAKHSKGLKALFIKCATGEVSSESFYEQLPKYWSHEKGDRLQGSGWERKGKNSDFRALAESYVRILKADPQERDDVVVEEIDLLHERKIPTRTAFLSEMLCLEFPSLYPVLNKPVYTYLERVNFKAPRGASEGAQYIDLAKKLRYSLMQNPGHVANNIAELDTVIWLAFGR